MVMQTDFRMLIFMDDEIKFGLVLIVWIDFWIINENNFSYLYYFDWVNDDYFLNLDHKKNTYISFIYFVVVMIYFND